MVANRTTSSIRTLPVRAEDRTDLRLVHGLVALAGHHAAARRLHLERLLVGDDPAGLVVDLLLLAPDAAFWSAAGRGFRDRSPERFHRADLDARRATLARRFLRPPVGKRRLVVDS